LFLVRDLLSVPVSSGVEKIILTSRGIGGLTT